MVTFIQRFGGAINLHVHYYVVFLEGAYLDRTDQGLTPRQQGVDGEEAKTGTPAWNWARLLGRVFALALAACPFCRRGSLRIIAAITQEAVMTRILRHCTLASVPPPIAPARLRQATFDWVAYAHDVTRGLGGDVCAVEVCLMSEEPLKSRLKSSPPQPSQSPFPRPSPQGTPAALPSPILRRLSSTSHSHAAPCAVCRRGVPAGLPRGAGRAGVSTARGGRRRGR